MCTLKKSFYMKYLSHRKMILTQALGMQLFVSVKVVLDVWQITGFAGVNLTKTEQFYVGSAVYYIQTFLAFVVVLTKRPEDCFACFNRLGPTRNYSIYQYPVEERFENTLSRIIREQEGLNRVSIKTGRRLSYDE